MTAYTEAKFSTQNEHVLEQIQLLRQVLTETTQKLDNVRERTSKAREDLKECTKDTKLRVDLLMENGEVIDVLQVLGQLLEKEHILKEQLSGQSEEDRRLWKELRDRNETITNKAQSLTCEFVEVKHQLDVAMAHFTTKSLESNHGSKPKISQTIPK